jgi:hypothetical protein
MDKLPTFCKECATDFKNLEALHRHFKAHQMTQAAYYQKWFPRYDKFDGNIIRFRTREFYFNSDFNTRENLGAWLKQVSLVDAKNYIVDYLLRRKKRKNLIYSPTQVELRTLPIPGRKYIENLGVNYFEFCEQLGFQNRFDLVGFSQLPSKFKRHHKVLIDTREQKPLTFRFSLKTQSEALPFGDYKLNDDAFTRNCYIERKAVGDLYGTMTSGLERFHKEIQRAKDACAYLVIVVEGNFEEVAHYPTRISVAGKVCIAPEYVFYQIRDLIQQYDHIQFLFVENRDEASRVIEKIFCSNGEYRRLDLQYAYDTKQL